MSEIIHKPCPYVACESSDAFDYNSVKKVGHCKSCERGYPSKEAMFSWAKDKYPVKERNEMNNVVDYTPKNIEEVGTWKYEAMRGVNASTMQDFNVRTYADRQEYIYPSGGIKVRKLSEKVFYTKDNFRSDELFGMNMFTAGSSKMVTVTEGELDALSVAQMLKSGYMGKL
jgi:hypothetical protein